MDGYKEAEKIDLEIHKILETYPVNWYPTEWAKCARTILTSVTILHKEAVEILLERKPT